MSEEVYALLENLSGINKQSGKKSLALIGESICLIIPCEICLHTEKKRENIIISLYDYNISV